MNDPKTPARRLREERRHMADQEGREPLRRRLLTALGEGPSTPSQLTGAVGAKSESVSRKLQELLKDGLVEVQKDRDDRRRSLYSLSRKGRVELGRHLTFGSPEETPPPPSPDEEVEFLWEALGGAVAMRRRSNRLGEALDRLHEIQSQAEELGASDLALEVLAELAITQRQDRRLKERRGLLERLRRMVSGDPDVEGRLVYPAIAHLEYERGKESDLGKRDLPALASHLTTAATLFEALVDERPDTDTRRWRGRRAWSVVSLANNLREQSRYEDSLRYAASSLRMFEELEDEYGCAQCWLLFGFCLRLLLQFDLAWDCLRHAHDLAESRENSFERVVVYCLVQMGEVRRCQSATDEARELLDAAHGHADSLDLHVAKAFASSGLAAAEFQEKHFEQAQATLKKAQGIFDTCEHSEGIALNARRQATVARHLSRRGVALDEPEVKGLLKHAQEIYFSLGSSAGVVACEVERGWMRTISPACGDVGDVENRLIEILGRGGERETVILDPWVPGVLGEFGKEVGGQLGELASDVYREANVRLSENGEQGVRSVSEVTEVSEGAEPSHGVVPSTQVAEMGGESRRMKASLVA